MTAIQAEPRGTRGSGPLLIDIKEVATLLGRSVSSLRRDGEAGRMPASITLGGSKRWRRNEIRAWVRAGCPATDDWEGLWPTE